MSLLEQLTIQHRNTVFTLQTLKAHDDKYDLLNIALVDDVNDYARKWYYQGVASEKTKLSFTNSSIILTMQESNITDLVSFNQQFKNFNEINLIGLDYL